MSFSERSAQLDFPAHEGSEDGIENLLLLPAESRHLLPDVRSVQLRSESSTEGPAGAIRQQAAERLAAHRLRRSHRHAASENLHDGRRGDAKGSGPEGRHSIAAAVAERYAASPSYRSFLAQEAQRAIDRAAAAAEIAARNAQAVAAAQTGLLAELELWSAPQRFTPETAVTLSSAEPAPAIPQQELSSPVTEAPLSQAIQPLAPETAAANAFPAPRRTVLKPGTPTREVSAGGLTIKLYEDLGRTVITPAANERARTAPRRNQHLQQEQDLQEAHVLDEEIAFRQSPSFDDFRDPHGSVEPLAANLVEFPRQLVAPRKARPRLAEGPLREEAPRSPQLRIFEVEPDQISSAPETSSTAPEWTSIRLGAHTAAPPSSEHAILDAAVAPSLLPPQTAPISLRMMAAAVDLILLLAAFLAFTAAAACISGSVPTGIHAVVAAGLTLAVLFLAFHTLFFSLGDQTPGMRYARIGFCTFSDENPTRSAMRRRLFAVLIAAVPLGIGLLWMWLDDDRLGWQDRISRMYQRAY